ENQDDNDEQTDLDNDGDDFVHPKLSTHDDEPRQDDEVNDEESDDESNEESTQVTEDTHVIITAPVNPEGQQQSSSVSSGFISNMLNPSLDSGIDSIFNLNTEATSLVDVPVTTIAKPPLLSTTTLPPPPTPLIIHLQQTPTKNIRNDFSKFKQTNQFAKAVSSIPGIDDSYMANKMNESVKTAVQIQLDRLRDEVQAKNENFINTLDDNIKKIIKEQVREQVKGQ
ncbi:hypothetical protein Tco_0124084, partial [Tanacetum coccineum]